MRHFTKAASTILVIGCVHTVTPPAVERTCVTSAASCDEKLQPSNAATAAGAGGTAIAVTRRGVVLFDPASRHERRLANLHPAWCAYDSGNRLVWALTRRQGRVELSTLSLKGETSTLVTFPTQATIPPPGSVEIVYARGRSLGQISGFSSQPELRVDLVAKKTFGVDSCDGDAIWYCSDTSTTDPHPDDSPPFERSERFTTQLAALSAGAFTDAGSLEPLLRRMHGDVRVNEAAVPRLHLACHAAGDHGDCGNGFSLAPSPYWAVKTAETRGDYLHELYHIYDPRTGSYFLPTSPQAKSAQPQQLSDWEPSGVKVSPDGRWMMEDHRVVDLEGAAPVAAIEVGCGWLYGEHP